MDGMMEKGRTEPAGSPQRSQEAGGGEPAGGPPQRFSAKRKLRAVNRLLRGDPLELVARELNVTAARLSEWRDRALLAAAAAHRIPGHHFCPSSSSTPASLEANACRLRLKNCRF